MRLRANCLKEMVGANGFEPSTSWSRTRRASQAALRPDWISRPWMAAIGDQFITEIPIAAIKPNRRKLEASGGSFSQGLRSAG
jgi:hypothetical protein